MRSQAPVLGKLGQIDPTCKSKLGTGLDKIHILDWHHHIHALISRFSGLGSQGFHSVWLCWGATQNGL